MTGSKRTQRPYVRLLHPLVRDGRSAPLRKATWDEALDRAAAGFKKAIAQGGGRATGIFSCSKGTNEMNYTAQKLVRLAFGSNNIDSCNRT